jgi:hypothetical protein
VNRRVDGRLDTDTVRDTPAWLTDSLLAKLGRSPATFVIVDGFDELPMGLQTRLQDTLKSLGPRLKVLLSRRVSVFQNSNSSCECNECGKELRTHFWQCSLCNTDEIGMGFDICYSCKEEHTWCNSPGHQNALVEPYSHVDICIRHDEGKSLELFAIRDLEREYTKEVSLLAPGQNSGVWTAQEKAQFITDKSIQDLAITKLRLDQVREEDSFQNVETVSDRLPRGIVAMYDSELDRIEAANPREMQLVLVAFRIIAHNNGIRADDLEEALEYIDGGFTCWTDVDYVYVRNVLRLARGLLLQEVENFWIYLYHQDFRLYVEERYNQNIVNCGVLFDKYLEWEQEQEAKKNILEAQDLETISSSPPNALLSFTADQPMDSKAPPAVLSRQSSTNSTDSGYYSSSPSPEEELIQDPISVHQRAQKPRQGKVKQDSRTSTFRAHMLCIFCQETIFQSHANHGHHHRPFSQLEVAANQGCPFCSSIYARTKECASREKRAHSALDECSARYWTLRTTGKILNDYDICVITFQAPEKKRKGCSDDCEVATERFFVTAETDLGHIPTADMLGPSTQLEDAETQIKSWIQNCNENHPGCEYKSTDPFVPTRLVDLETGDSEMVRIVETAKHRITRPYVTLSHCWGKHRFLTLRRSNEKLLTTKGVRISELNLNFQEAIKVAKSIGMRYIWIDSICIVQGDDGDFKTEGNYMHKVYRFSYCNIVAADSPDSTFGVFRERDAKSIIPAVYEAGDDSKLENGTWRILKENLWKDELLETPIYARGWVFQGESLRILIFDLLPNNTQNACSPPESFISPNARYTGTVVQSAPAKRFRKVCHSASTDSPPQTATGAVVYKKQPAPQKKSQQQRAPTTTQWRISGKTHF